MPCHDTLRRLALDEAIPCWDERLGRRVACAVAPAVVVVLMPAAAQQQRRGPAVEWSSAVQCRAARVQSSGAAGQGAGKDARCVAHRLHGLVARTALLPAVVPVPVPGLVLLVPVPVLVPLLARPGAGAIHPSIH